MDRENGPKRELPISNEYGNESCRPIVAVDQFWSRGESSSKLHDRFSKKNKSFGVIFISPAVSSIDTASIKVFVSTNQEYLNLFRTCSLNEVGRHFLSSEVDLKFDAGRSDIVVAFANRSIERHHDADVMTKPL